jgi:serine/tyrosine/threonine adenylyltransferase
LAALRLGYFWPDEGGAGLVVTGDGAYVWRMLIIPFDNTYARDLEGMYLPVQGDVAPAPRMLLLNVALADELGLDADALRSEAGLAMLTGGAMPQGAAPLAMAYAGHQFGGFSPQLGDGRALLVGEVMSRAGQRRDIHLKGSGRTPFSRGGDGKAALGPVVREYILGEAMAALGIPTTRALACVATGERVLRQEGPLPGAVLARVAASHIRVGTFQFFAARGERERLTRLADHAIARHDPDLTGTADRYLAFLHRVTERQMSLVARWMAVGFVHGVMNTDNCAVSGETIDYGPCAFVDAYAPGAVFSSIDRGGRYAYANQPLIAQWNLARLAEALLPLIAPDDTEGALPEVRAVIEGAADVHARTRRALFGEKLGLAAAGPGDDALIDGFLDLLAADGADFTQTFRALSWAARGGSGPSVLLSDAGEGWRARWQARLAGEDGPAERMDAANPAIIARNHQVEAALAAATAGDMAPTERLLAALARPFVVDPAFADLAGPPPADFGPYVTYCGT